MTPEEKIKELEDFILDMWAHYKVVLEDKMCTPQFVARREAKVRKILSGKWKEGL